MRASFSLLILGIFAGTLSYSAQIPLSWHRGSVTSDQSGRVSVTIKHGDGSAEVIRISDLLLVSEGVNNPFSSSMLGSPSNKSYAFIQKFSKAEGSADQDSQAGPNAQSRERTEVLLQSEVPERNMPFEFLTAASYVDKLGRKAVLLVNPRVIKGDIEMLWIVLEKDAENPGSFKALQATKSSLPTSAPCIPSRVFLAPGLSDDRVDFIAFDSERGSIFHLDFARPFEGTTKLELARSLSGNMTFVKLPGDFPRGSFSEDAFAFVLDQEKHRLRVDGASGFSTYVLMGNGSADQVSLEETNFADHKSPDWVFQFERVKAFIGEDASKVDAAMRAKVVAGLGKWLVSAKNPEIASMGMHDGKDGGKNVVSILSVSDSVLAIFPDLKDRVLAIVLDEIVDMRPGRTTDSPFLFTRFQERTNHDSMNAPLWLANYIQMRGGHKFAEAFAFADATRSHHEAAPGALLSFTHSVVSDIARAGRFNVLAVVSKKALEKTLEGIKGLGALTVMDIDTVLGEEQKMLILAKQLGIEPHIVTQIEKAIADQAKGGKETSKKLFSDLDVAITWLKPFVRGVDEKLDRSSPEYAKQVAQALLSMLGQSKLSGFDAKLKTTIAKLDEKLAASKSAQSNELFSRGPQLRSIRDRLLGYMSSGYKKAEPLTITLMGDSGTGKTATYEALVKYLESDAAIEYVNFTEISQKKASKTRYRYRPSFFGELDEFEDGGVEKSIEIEPKEIVETLAKRAGRLRSDSRALKILVLDEVHARPDVLGQLVPSFGNGDSKDAVINLRGIVVILMSNTKRDSQSYQDLVKLSPDSPAYKATLVRLLEESLADVPEKQRMDEKLAHALATRLMQGMIFYPPPGNDSAAEEGILSQIIQGIEYDRKIRLFMPKDAAAYLARKAQESKKMANFRGIGQALEDALSQAIGRYSADNPSEEKLVGRYILTLESRQNSEGTSAQELTLEPVDDPIVGAKWDVRDKYQRFMQLMVQATKLGIAEYRGAEREARARMRRARDKKSRDEVETEVASYKSMMAALDVVLQSLLRASSKPFFLTDVPREERARVAQAMNFSPNKKTPPTVLRVAPDICYPECYVDTPRQRQDKALEEPLRRIFDPFMLGKRRFDLNDPKLQGSVAAAIIHQLGLMTKMDRQVTEKGINRSEFRAWVNRMVDLDQYDERIAKQRAVVGVKRGFIAKHWAVWQELKEALGGMVQDDQHKRVFKFAKDLTMEYQELLDQQPSLKEDEDLGSFVKAFETKKDKDAESIAKKMEEAKSGGESGGSTATRDCEALLLSLAPHSSAKATAWLMVDHLRRAAEDRFVQLTRDIQSETDSQFTLATGEKRANSRTARISSTMRRLKRQKEALDNASKGLFE